MGRFVTLNGGTTGPAIHVPDPPRSLEEIAIDPMDVWRSQPSVRKVVNFAARNIASIPVHVYRRTDDDSRERVRTGKTVDLLSKPAPFMTPYRFFHTLHVDGMVWDKWCFVRLEADDEGPEQFFRVPPVRFRVIKDVYGNPEAIVIWAWTGNEINKRLEEYRLDPSVCVFDSGYSTSWGDPTPPVHAINDLLTETLETRKYRQELLRNGARVANVIERPKDAGEWSDTAWTRFRSQFASYKAGGGEAGGTPVLEDGMKLVKVEAFDPQSLQTLEARKLTDIEVASFFHIPPELVGSREGTFANLDAFRQMLFSVALGPAIVAFEQALDVMLRPLLGAPDNEYIELHVESKLRGSFLEQTQQLQSAVGAPYMTRNEARSRLNMPAIDGGDEIITPLNVITGGLASPRDTAPKNVSRETLALGRNVSRETLALTSNVSRETSKGRPKGLANVDTERDAFVRRMEKHWQEQSERIMASLDLKALPDVWGAFDSEAETAALAPIIQAHMQRLAEIGAWEVLEQWNPDSEGWGPEMIEGWIAKASLTNAQRWTHNVENGLTEAATHADPVESLKAFLGGTGLVVAFAIAFATEAHSFGGTDAARKSGLGTKTWRVHSKNPRPSHAAQNGDTVGINDLFGNGQRWPGDSAGGAAENANCTCSLTYGKEDE